MIKKIFPALALIVLLAISFTNTDLTFNTGNDWPVYGGNKAGNRYSPLKQINTDNVTNLKVAWMYDAAEPTNPANPNQGVKAIQ